MILKKKNILNSIMFKKLNNKIFLKGKKYKYLKILFNVWKYLKKKKIKPFFFFFLIIEKLRPIFFFSKIIKKRRKKIIITYKPFLLSFKQQYLVAIKWFIITIIKKKKKKFFFFLKNCFLSFLDNKFKNLSLFQKKKVYLTILKNRRFIKF